MYVSKSSLGTGASLVYRPNGLKPMIEGSTTNDTPPRSLQSLLLNWKPKAVFNLMRLPAELCCEVYRHAVLRPDPINLHQDYRRRRITFRIPKPNLALTNSLVRKEVLHIYYSENVFRLPYYRDWACAPTLLYNMVKHEELRSIKAVQACTRRDNMEPSRACSGLVGPTRQPRDGCVVKLPPDVQIMVHEEMVAQWIDWLTQVHGWTFTFRSEGDEPEGDVEMEEEARRLVERVMQFQLEAEHAKPVWGTLAELREYRLVEGDGWWKKRWVKMA